MAQEWNEGIQKITTTKYTGATTMADSLAPAVGFELIDIRIHVTVAATTAQDLTITLDAKAGDNYDILLYTKAMAGVTDIVKRFYLKCVSGDTIDFAWTNGDSRTYTITARYRRLA